MTCADDGRVMVWGARWLAEAVSEGSTLRWFRETQFTDAFLRRPHAAPNGALTLHKTRVVEDAGGTSDRDEIEFKDRSGKTVRSWKPGFGFADVRFGGDTAWINTFEKIVEIRQSGEQRELLPLGSREVDLTFASKDMQVVCRKRLERPRVLDDPHGVDAGCRSTSGWSFNGNWGYFSPVYCGGYVVAFEDKPGQPRGEHRWHRAIVHRVSSGEVVATRDASGRYVSCWQDRALVEIDSGRIWNLPAFKESPIARCGDESAAVWAEGAGCPWCVGSSGFVQRVTEVQVSGKASTLPNATPGRPSGPR